MQHKNTPFVKLLLIAFCLAFGASPVWAAGTQYELDPAHAYIGFSVKHMMASEVKGAFTDYEGTIHYDPNNIEDTKIDITIQSYSVDTRSPKRNDHLRQEDFLNVEKYPTILFTSDRIEERNGIYYLIGGLTIRNVSKWIEVPCIFAGPMESPFGAEIIGLTGSIIINRQDFGVRFNRPLDNGGFVIGNLVKIEFSFEAVKSSDMKKLLSKK
ncbi:MAG: YceI family protein [Candidatus Omnitrophica bacterium]|nr:YceI family protein [Candidatus Omnitrophota bacterium]